MEDPIKSNKNSVILLVVGRKHEEGAGVRDGHDLVHRGLWDHPAHPVSVVLLGLKLAVVLCNERKIGLVNVTPVLGAEDEEAGLLGHGLGLLLAADGRTAVPAGGPVGARGPVGTAAVAGWVGASGPGAHIAIAARVAAPVDLDAGRILLIKVVLAGDGKHVLPVGLADCVKG